MTTRVAVGCDRCGALTAGFIPGVMKVPQLRAIAREGGWKRFRVRGTGQCVDACPTCQPSFGAGVIEVDEFGAKR